MVAGTVEFQTLMRKSRDMVGIAAITDKYDHTRMNARSTMCWFGRLIQLELICCRIAIAAVAGRLELEKILGMECFPPA